ncbi:LacI family DNA-binding transcriptional regulator [Paraburkholderia oxyphila]|uniref:LacI family DNA-binding transcriptional regulator n=1 Tax=Paraburkholderia oxyphila TaxID=614212 RepID=UPI0005BB7A3E|nr:LacI family DNA-binding transcriptional regulator [Paraburkholderia oxyphila]
MAAVTLVDLARALGLSKTTVSDALIGSGRVSEETRKRVADAAQAMGYVSNKAARSLRRRNMGALGLYIPPYARALSFYMHFAFGAVAGASAAGSDLTLHASEARQFHVDGAVVIDALDDDPVVQRMLDASLPIVFAEHSFRSLSPDQPVAIIEIDHHEVVDFVLDKLRVGGAKRPGYIGLDLGHAPGWAIEAHHAFEAGCARQGIAPRTATLATDHDERDLFRAIEHLVKEDRIDALVVGLQGAAAVAIPMLQQLGQPVAQRDEPGFHLASLAGDPVTELGSAQILAMDLEPKKFGLSAVELLIEIIETPPKGIVHRRHRPNVFLG